MSRQSGCIRIAMQRQHHLAGVYVHRHINYSEIPRKKKHQTNWQTMATAKEPDTYKHVRTYEGSGWYPALADGEQALSEQGAST